MAIQVLPAALERFDDVATMLAPARPDVPACWCLANRLGGRDQKALAGGEGRREYVRGLCARAVPPGVLAYSGGEVVGWCGVAPRAELHAFRRGGLVPWPGEDAVWSVFCFKVRGGHRRQGVAGALLAGAMELARANRAPAVEGYPMDNAGARVSSTLGFVGTRSMFEKAGFTKVADTQKVAAGIPRVLMRLELA